MDDLTKHQNDSPELFDVKRKYDVMYLTLHYKIMPSRWHSPPHLENMNGTIGCVYKKEDKTFACNYTHC